MREVVHCTCPLYYYDLLCLLYVTMFKEADFQDSVQYFILNLVSAFLCAAAHNALYFMMGLSHWAFHFMHYFFTFIMLSGFNVFGMIPQKNIEWREILPISLSQLGVTFATGIIHSGGKDGALYTLRLTDFAVTLIAIALARKMLDPTCHITTNRNVVVFSAVGASLAWLEFGIVDYDILTLLMTPILAVCSAVHFIVTFQKAQKLGVHVDQLMLYATGMTSAMLILPAVFFTSDSFNKEILGTAAAWEVIDYALFAMGMVFMVGLIYSKYWLLCHVTPETYLVMRHTKYTVASIGQWFTQNMAHVTVFSVLGKFMAVGALGYYTVNRYRMHANSLKFPHTLPAKI